MVLTELLILRVKTDRNRVIERRESYKERVEAIGEDCEARQHMRQMERYWGGRVDQCDAFLAVLEGLRDEGV